MNTISSKTTNNNNNKQQQIFFFLRITLVHFLTKPYPPAVREGLTQLCSGGTVRDVCRYNFLLGVLFAEAAQQVVSEAGHSMNDITVIGSHGWAVM